MSDSEKIRRGRSAKDEATEPQITLQDIYNIILAIKADNDDNKVWQQNVNKQLKDLSKEQKKITADLITLKSECGNNSSALQTLDTSQKQLEAKVRNIELKIEDLEQRSRIMNIEIIGIPETKSEDCQAIVKAVAAVAGIQSEDGDIQTAHRVPSKKGTHRPIIACLATRALKTSWIQKLRKIKNLSAKDVHSSFPQSRVYVNEHLSSYFKSLLYETKNYAKENGYKYVWVSDQKILMRKDAGLKSIRIKNAGDLKCILPTEPILTAN